MSCTYTSLNNVQRDAALRRWFPSDDDLVVFLADQLLTPEELFRYREYEFYLSLTTAEEIEVEDAEIELLTSGAAKP